MSRKTAWNHKNVAHAWKIDFPHLLLRDTPWWVNKRGIFVLFRSAFVFQKNWKNCTCCQPLQNGGHQGPSINTRTSLLKSAEASSCFSFGYICVGGIGILFNPKTRSFRLTLNSRLVFKNDQYFLVSKSNFGAFFRDKFFLCGIAPNHLRFKLSLVKMLFFSKI